MQTEAFWKLIIILLSIVSVAGGFLHWHFSAINQLKDDIHRLESKGRELEHEFRTQQRYVEKLGEIYILLFKS